MSSITCATADCSENGIPKDLGALTVWEDEPIFCGECGEPIDIPPDILDDIETRGPAPQGAP
jgi:hypothetical protein